LLSTDEKQDNIIKAYLKIPVENIKACLEYANEEAGGGALDIL